MKRPQVSTFFFLQQQWKTLQREEEEEGVWEWEGEEEWEVGVGVELVEEFMAKEDNNFQMKSEQP